MVIKNKKKVDDEFDRRARALRENLKKRKVKEIVQMLPN